MAASRKEQYWNERARAETMAALACDDPHLASLHVDLATRCVRKALDERQRTDEDLGNSATDRQLMRGPLVSAMGER